jgi:hypothetical protein
MDETPGPGFDASLTSSILEHELRLVSEAIDVVASGQFPSVTVAGLRFGTELLPRAQAVASGRGLRVRPLFHADEHGTDIVVERPAEPEPEAGR